MSTSPASFLAASMGVLGAIAGAGVVVALDDSGNWGIWASGIATAIGIAVAGATLRSAERAAKEVALSREEHAKALYMWQSRALDHLALIEDRVETDGQDQNTSPYPPAPVLKALYEVKRSSSALAEEGAVDEAREIDALLRAVLSSTHRSSWLLSLPKDADADADAGSSS